MKLKWGKSLRSQRITEFWEITNHYENKKRNSMDRLEKKCQDLQQGRTKHKRHENMKEKWREMEDVQHPFIRSLTKREQSRGEKIMNKHSPYLETLVFTQNWVNQQPNEMEKKDKLQDTCWWNFKILKVQRRSRRSRVSIRDQIGLPRKDKDSSCHWTW